MTVRFVAGIDPGLSGAIAMLRDDGALFVTDMPTVEVRRAGTTRRLVDRGALARAFDRTDLRHVYLELVGARPGQSAGSGMTTARNAGIVEGVVVANYHPVDVIAPAAWKRAMRCPAGKDGARARATELMPACAGLWTRKRDDGRAEAALIALYGCRQLSYALDRVFPGVA
jgi:crossover junction endodeoxyribonuclease RuvC